MLRITVLRKARGLSQAELTRRVPGLHPAELSRIESGRTRPYDPLLKRIALALRVRAADAHMLLDDVQGGSGEVTDAPSRRAAG